MMKVYRNNQIRDDKYRLLFDALLSTGLHVKAIEQIKMNIYRLFCSDEQIKIIKGYSQLLPLISQYVLTNYLKATGFTQAAVYQTFPNGQQYIKIGSKYWGIMNEVEYDGTLNYKNISDRQMAFYTLFSYHQYVSVSPDSIKNIFPNYPIIRILEKRLSKIIKYQDDLCRILGSNITNQLISWGIWSVEELMDTVLPEHPMYQSIIHGDVAAHNLLKSKYGNVTIIDFDCAAIGSPGYDYLQLTNRMLSHINWDIHAFRSIPFICNDYLNKKWFLIALVFPMELYRHLPLLLQSNSLNSKQKIIQASDKQTQFVRQIKNMIK